MPNDPHAEDAPARLLALMLAAGGCNEPHQIQRLEELEAFPRIGVGRGRFVDLLGDCVDEHGARLADCSWLRDADAAHVDSLMALVRDPQQRLLLCQLASAVLGPDDSVSNCHRLVLDHVLSRWHIDPALAATIDITRR